jgi:hypothetical protein
LLQLINGILSREGHRLLAPGEGARAGCWMPVFRCTTSRSQEQISRTTNLMRDAGVAANSKSGRSGRAGDQLPAARSARSEVRAGAGVSPNFTDLRPETPDPRSLNGKPPIEVLVPDTSRGGRAGRKFGLSTAGNWSAKMRKTALQ